MSGPTIDLTDAEKRDVCTTMLPFRSLKQIACGDSWRCGAGSFNATMPVTVGWAKT